MRHAIDADVFPLSSWFVLGYDFQKKTPASITPITRIVKTTATRATPRLLILPRSRRPAERALTCFVISIHMGVFSRFCS